MLQQCSLTHWGQVMHICVGKLIIIGSDNGLSPGRRQAIIWNNAGIWLMGPLGTNFSEILMIQFHSRKCTWKCRLWNNSYCWPVKWAHNQDVLAVADPRVVDPRPARRGSHLVAAGRGHKEAYSRNSGYREDVALDPIRTAQRSGVIQWPIICSEVKNISDF